MQGPLLFLVGALSNLYILAFVLRFVFQLIRMDYDNPLAQSVVQITNPLVVPARRWLPSIRYVDLPTLIVIVALECLATILLLLILRYVPPVAVFPLTVPQFLLLVLRRLLSLAIGFYIFMLLLYVAVSWFVGGTRHPMMRALSEIVTPILRPVRRLLPPTSGIDFSPMLVTIILIALWMALRTPF